VNDAIVLDAGPAGFLCNPRPGSVARLCQVWLTQLLANSRRVILPEISDYEVRRELIRLGAVQSLDLLNDLTAFVEYLPLTTTVMRAAADLWALARNSGYPTAGPHRLDADVILAAQALSLNVPVVIATTNVRHLSRFVPAEEWPTITP
jgi:predicted nucleic acid-binding protein